MRWKNEGKLNAHLTRILEPAGRAIKIAGGFYQESGIPDILFVAKSSSIAHFIEVKIYPRKPTPKQLAFCETQGLRGINTYLLTYYPTTDTYELYSYKHKEHHVLLDGAITWGHLHPLLGG